ncbi:MAG: hypothetical protein B6244_01210 [Candidatus Cloacimonetes bacterium 4572_55]|nr:MAG: hypothetical protein B6244_01210 [Candidatus Cloacimonetes bacterium 4572_55]
MGQIMERFLVALENFSSQLTAKFSAYAAGEPEDQLKSPVDQLLTAYGELGQKKLVLKGESTLAGRLGRPDFAAHHEQLPIGYIELKAPGKGANPALYKGHDLNQWKRFKNVPNIIYTDGNQWALYQQGKLVGKRVRMDGDVRTDGKKTVSQHNATALFELLANFTDWMPIVPRRSDLLAAFLAPFCRLIRDEVMDSLKDLQSPMQSLKREIKMLLFPDADDMRFADAYAQTVIFGLLLAQLEGSDVLDLRNAYDTLEKHHSLLSRSLEFLTDRQALREISSSLSMTQRVIHEIPAGGLISKSDEKDPWLFFYEDFLAVYDPKLRREAGVYYTPIQVVRCQVRLIDEILTKKMGKVMGFVEPGVTVLDPALGTGTYLLTLIQHALKRIEDDEGPGAIRGGARMLTKNLHGFEWMVGPYAVAQLRFSQVLSQLGVSMPNTGPNTEMGIYLTNTLESPHMIPPIPPLFQKPIAQEHERALKIKDADRVLICLGNPPYGRHAAITAENRAVTGGWVRHGDDTDNIRILKDFLEPAREAGHGRHLKNLYNLYVYFIRWAVWKVFEHKSATGPGIVSLITAASYIHGDAFSGMREHLRRVCDHIDIIDLGGEGRGTRRDDNVFAIQTPVAIFVASRKGKVDKNKPATVRYTRIQGGRDEKLRALDQINHAADLEWQEVPTGWQAPFRPTDEGDFFTWPSICDVFPWQNNGVQCKRTWPIAPTEEVIKKRWQTLLRSDNRARAMKESGDRTIALSQTDIFDLTKRLQPIEKLKEDELPHKIAAYAYRSFDRQYLLADNRLISRPRLHLWLAHSNRQIYMTSLFNHPLGFGPAITVCANIPDLHHFRASYGAKEAMPLYRDQAATKPNILPGLLDQLTRQYDAKITPEDMVGYVYGLLAQPTYTQRFHDELINRDVRVPLTKDGKLFRQVADYGQWLIWLHTYGERLYNTDRPQRRIPRGSARCTKAISDAPDAYPNDFSYDEKGVIHIGDGEFAPVIPEIWDFQVSGFKVTRSWLGYRMKNRKGRKSSPLDDIHPRVWPHQFTREFLELLWVLEKTIAGYSEQERLFHAVLESELFTANKLPPVPDRSRKPPKVPKPKKKQLDLI